MLQTAKYGVGSINPYALRTDNLSSAFFFLAFSLVINLDLGIVIPFLLPGKLSYIRKVQFFVSVIQKEIEVHLYIVIHEYDKICTSS